MPIFTSGRGFGLQEILKLIPIPNKRTLRKKAIVIKDENEEGDKARKNWVDGEVLHLIALRGELEPKFAKNAKKQGKFCLCP
jgi:hypothetical protein